MSLRGDVSEPLDPIIVVDFSCFNFFSQPCCARSRDLIDFAGWHQQETDIENRYMDKAGGEEGEGEMTYGESNIEIYNTMCKTDSQWEFAV